MLFEASPRLGFARSTTRMLYLGGRCFVPAPPTSPDRRPSGEHGVKDLPPSSLDCSSRWCCSLFRPTIRKDVCRIERPFARTLNVTSPQPPPEGGEGRGTSGLLLLAEPAYAPRPSPTATTDFVTGFRPRCVCLSRLSTGTVGGSVCCRLRVVPPAACLPLFSCLLLRPLKGCADLSRRGDVSFSVRRSDDRRIGACCLYYYICCGSQVVGCLNPDLKDFED